MIHLLSTEVVLNGLRLLLEIYKVQRDRFKDRHAPDRVEEIVIEAEKDREAISTAEIDRKLSESLAPVDAAIIKNDLELLGLLQIPTSNLDAFDYWGMLGKVVTALHAFASEKRLFQLRGVRQRFGEVLVLPKTGEAIFPREYAIEMAIPGSMESVKDGGAVAFLEAQSSAFPLHVLVGAELNQYSSMGGKPGVKFEQCWYKVSQGDYPHWLKFTKWHDPSYGFSKDFEYMLKASDFEHILAAFKDDIYSYAQDVQIDEQKVGPLFKAITQFCAEIPSPSNQK